MVFEIINHWMYSGYFIYNLVKHLEIWIMPTGCRPISWCLWISVQAAFARASLTFICLFNNLDGVCLLYGEGEFTLLFHFKHEVKKDPVAYIDIWTSGHVFSIGQRSSEYM